MGFFFFYERTEVHGSVLQWGLDGHGWVLHCSRSGGLSWISQLRSLKRSPFGRWHTTSLVFIPPPHGFVHWGRHTERSHFIDASLWIKKKRADSHVFMSKYACLMWDYFSVSFLPLPSCHTPTVDMAPIRRIFARWVGCDLHSCWQGSRSHPGTLPHAAGSLLHMCWSTVFVFFNRDKRAQK